MDNLPKKPADDWSTFAGTYPTDKPGTSPPPPPPGGKIAPVAAPAATDSPPPAFGGAASAPPGPKNPDTSARPLQVTEPVIESKPFMETKPVEMPLSQAGGSMAPMPSDNSASLPEKPAPPPAPPPFKEMKDTGFTVSAKEPMFQNEPVVTAAVDPFTPPPASQVPPPTPIADIGPTPTPVSAQNNPFVISASGPGPSGKGGGGGLGKRVLAFVVLLVALLGIGYVAFHFLGGFLSQNQPVTLTYWGLWEDDQLLKPIIAEYKKTHPKVEIVYTKQSLNQYRERLQAAIARGDGPDLFRFHNTWVPMLKNDLAPAGKTGYSAAEFQQTFYPVSVSDLVLTGKVYGAPLEIDGLGLYYNEDLLRAAGVTPPTSWEEFRQAALALTVKDQTGKIITAGTALGTTGNIEHFSDILGVMMLQNGANLKSPNTKEAGDALSFYHLFADKANPVWDDTLDNSILAFSAGRAAMIFAPSWEVFTIKQANPNLKFQIVNIPQLPGTSATWASYWVEGVSAKSKHQDAAWEFLKFLTSKESEVSLYTEEAKTRAFGEPYSRIDLAQTLVNDPYVGAYIRQAPTAQSFFLSSRTGDNGINDRMIKYLEDAVNSLGKGVDVTAALDTVSKGFAQVLSSFGSAP